MTLFKGLGQLYTPVRTVSSTTPQGSINGPCVVLDVMLSERDARGAVFPYNGPEDIGKIRVRDIFATTRKKDEDIKGYAWPTDRKTVSYPLPGEIVWVFYSPSDEVDETGNPVLKYYYQSILTQNGSITYNSLPDLGDKRNNDTPVPGGSSQGSLADAVSNFINNTLQKFNRKLKNRDSFIKENINNNNVLGVVVKERPALQPYEGDALYQGRFGQSIRFGSTTAKQDNKWSTEGLSGAPIMMHRVHDKLDPNNQVSYVSEDINEDNSSIYLCSTQKVEMRLSCSANMYSWRTIYKLENKSSDPNIVNTVTNNEDGTLIYQKVVDMGQTLDSQLGTQTTETPTTPTQPNNPTQQAPTQTTQQQNSTSPTRS